MIIIKFKTKNLNKVIFNKYFSKYIYILKTKKRILFQMLKICLQIILFSLFIMIGFSKITDLTDNNFDSETTPHNTGKYLITFYSPQCPHCL